jgi:hypothetical protein
MPSYLCAVNEVGPANSGLTSNPNVYINLTDRGGTFANTWFYAADGLQQHMLAQCIAAMSEFRYVTIVAAAPNAGGSPYNEITNLYLSWRTPWTGRPREEPSTQPAGPIRRVNRRGFQVQPPSTTTNAG